MAWTLYGRNDRKACGERDEKPSCGPISFVSDHIETLYEIDILYKGMAEKLGMRLERVRSLNTSPLFISALQQLVVQEWRRLDG